jgi:hypothetical protein
MHMSKIDLTFIKSPKRLTWAIFVVDIVRHFMPKSNKSLRISPMFNQHFRKRQVHNTVPSLHRGFLGWWWNAVHIRWARQGNVTCTTVKGMYAFINAFLSWNSNIFTYNRPPSSDFKYNLYCDLPVSGIIVLKHLGRDCLPLYILIKYMLCFYHKPIIFLQTSQNTFTHYSCWCTRGVVQIWVHLYTLVKYYSS